VFEERDEVYPLEEGGVVFGSHELKVVFDREKTGFEEEREMPIVINEVVAGRWQIVGMLGQAQFSKALEVKDLAAGGGKQRYCLKVIHNNKEYMDQALDEVKLHRYLRANCDLDASCLLRMHDYFYHREHLMILTELLRDNLYEAARARPHYFTLPRLQAVARQLLAALSTLHRLHVIHSDLKPENVLIKSYSNVQVRLIDFGSSVFFHGPLEPYVQTRSYRAPEVILGLEYTDRIDIWSLGCLLAELLTGQVLFEGDSAVAVLAKVQGMRGPWPSWMLHRGAHVDQYFRKELVLFQELTEEAGQDEDGRPRNRKTGLLRLFRPKTTNLKARLRSNHPAFLDFISKCLKIDPSHRPSARELQLHPFITESIPE
jgi:serine/threonine protein kinase